jgi:uncharacterized protein YggE
MSADNIEHTISVTGIGRSTAAADIALLNLAVETQAVTASDALTENSKLATAVLSALKDSGIHEQDVETTGLSIVPLQDDKARPPKIVSYRVRDGLNAKLRNIHDAGVVIDAAVQAGGDALRIENISFSLADPSSLLVKARKQAIADAKERANQLASGLGVKLGNVVSVSESESRTGPKFLALEVGNSTPILPGQSEVADQVTVSYEIDA